MRSGQLDRRVTIERRAVITSAAGQATETWTQLGGPVWASIRPLRGYEVRGAMPNAPQQSAHEEMAVEMRWSPSVAALNPKDRVMYEGRILDILAVHEIGRREGVKLIVKRRAD